MLFENVWSNITELTVSTSTPNGNLEKWTGSSLEGTFNNAERTQTQLDLDNLLPRGAALQNSKYIITMVVYTGEEL